MLPMIGTAAILREEDFVLSSRAPGRGQKRLALMVVAVLVISYLSIAGPLAAVQLPRVDAYFPIYATAMFVNDAITAVLLFAQFSILRSRALLAISGGYLFTAVAVIPRLLTFPGVVAPSGVFGDVQSAAWLYIISHTGFATLVIAYALLKQDDPSRRLSTRSVSVAIYSTVGVTIGIVVAATYLVTTNDAALPSLMRDAVRYSRLWPYVAAIPFMVSIAALLVLWARRGSVLDLWLMVVMCASVIDISLISFPIAGRFGLRWYSGRAFEVLAGSLVLLVLLYEITTLYARLLRAVAAQRRERAARLMTGDAVSASIAHEIRQPLAAMTTRADAGRRWLDREAPDLPEAMAAFEGIAMDGRRASAVIEGIRGMFKKDAATRTSIDMNELVSEALALLRGELAAHGISVRTDSSGRAPQVNGDRVQLQQVFLNLASNAIESMEKTEGPRELRVRSAAHESGGAVVSVVDTGPGIEPKDIDQIFSPLFTTKAHGMGMGLSICRSIVEAHDGQLWVTANEPHGANFQFLIPAAPGTPPGAQRSS
jgi:signal transduction histidine kinase